MSRFLQAASRTIAGATALGFTLMSAAAWAQGSSSGGSGGSTTSSSGATPWVLPYALLILCVFLGVFVVVRPSKRRDRPKN